MKNKTFIFFHLPALLTAVLILIASTLPLSDTPFAVKVSDKTLHLIAYFGFSFLLARSFSNTKTLVLKDHFVILGSIAASLYGFFAESLQLLTPHRSFEVLDIAANTAGALLGCGIYWLFSRTLSCSKPRLEN